MANPFDQFDPVDSNPFDRFDPAPERPDKVGFLDRVSEDLDKRKAEYDEIQLAAMQGIAGVEGGQTSLETGFQAAALAANTALDVVGEAIVGVASAIGDIYPDETGVEAILKRKASNIIERVLEHRLVPLPGPATLQEVAPVISEKYEEFAEESPRAARNIKAAGTTLFVAAPVPKGTKSINAIEKRLSLEKIASNIDDVTAKQMKNNKKIFVEKLVMPKELKKIRVEQVTRTKEKGLLRQKHVKPSFSEKQMIKEVAKVPGVSIKNTLQGNWNLINKASRRLARKLEKDLKNSKIIVPKQAVIRELDNSLAALRESPLLVGNAETSAKRILQKAKALIDEAPGTPYGLLKARRELDNWILNQKPKVFVAETESAMTIAVREVRGIINKNLVDSIPTVSVKKSLSRQSNLLRAMENIQLKAADEAANSILRTWHKFLGLLPLRGEFNQGMAAIFGVGGLGASALFAPMFTKLAFGTVGVIALYKVLGSPASKKALSMMIRGIDEAMKKTTDPRVLAELRLDRATLLELLELKPEDLD